MQCCFCQFWWYFLYFISFLKSSSINLSHQYFSIKFSATPSQPEATQFICSCISSSLRQICWSFLNLRPHVLNVSERVLSSLLKRTHRFKVLLNKSRSRYSFFSFSKLKSSQYFQHSNVIRTIILRLFTKIEVMRRYCDAISSGYLPIYKFSSKKKSFPQFHGQKWPPNLAIKT